MAKYTVYLDKDEDKLVRAHAKSLDLSLTEVLRQRIQSGNQVNQLTLIEQKIDSIFALLDYVIGDLGFVVGATRGGSRDIEAITSEAELYQGSFQRMARSLRAIYQHKNRNSEEH